MQPGLFCGAIKSAIASAFFAGMGRGFVFRSHPSTVAGLTSNFSASAARDVPVAFSHSLNLDLSIARVY